MVSSTLSLSEAGLAERCWQSSYCGGTPPCLSLLLTRDWRQAAVWRTALVIRAIC